jgi:hypothetical protein
MSGSAKRWFGSLAYPGEDGPAGGASSRAVRLEEAVEAICQRGCRAVRRIIQDLEAGREVREARGLTPAERRDLHAELVAIMSVYGPVCRMDEGEAEEPEATASDPPPAGRAGQPARRR